MSKISLSILLMKDSITVLRLNRSLGRLLESALLMELDEINEFGYWFL